MTLLNIPQLISDLTPMNLRQPIRNDWLHVLNYQLIKDYDDFKEDRDNDIYDVSHGPQTMSLQELLNDKFDNVNRLITIDDGIWLDDTYIYNKSENINTYFYNIDEIVDPSLINYLYNPSESQDLSLFYDFTVTIPASLTSEIPNIIILLNKYKSYGFIYKIITI